MAPRRLAEDRLQGGERCGKIAGLHMSGCHGKNAFAVVGRQLQEGSGALDAILRRITDARMGIGIRQFRVRTKAPGGFDDP